MAYDTSELETVYDTFLKKGLDSLKELQMNTGMEDEHLANASSQVIVGAMTGAVSTIEMLKRNEFVDAQIATEKTKDKILKQKYVGREQ